MTTIELTRKIGEASASATARRESTPRSRASDAIEHDETERKHRQMHDPFAPTEKPSEKSEPGGHERRVGEDAERRFRFEVPVQQKAVGIERVDRDLFRDCQKSWLVNPERRR
jgi:hypothetical protein